MVTERGLGDEAVNYIDTVTVEGTEGGVDSEAGC